MRLQTWPDSHESESDQTIPLEALLILSLLDFIHDNVLATDLPDLSLLVYPLKPEDC